MIVYSNSCSFADPSQGHTIYPDCIAQHLNAQLINRGLNGSSNRRIIRSSLRDLVELRQQNQTENVLAVIGLTFIARTELWQPWLTSRDNDGDFHTIQINYKKFDWSKGLTDTVVPDVYRHADHRIQDYYKNWLLHLAPEAEITNVLTDILMFAGWCRSNNIDYLIFANPDQFDSIDLTAPFIKSLYKEVVQDPKIIDPWQFSFGTYALSKNYQPKDAELYGRHGHPNEQAHIDFADHLVVNYLNV